jgi:hypothetical protein
MTPNPATRPGRTASAHTDRGSPHGRVVVGVHGSERSLAALEWAARLASARGWELDVVTAWPEPEEAFVHEVPGHHCLPRNRAGEQLETALARIRPVIQSVPDVGARLVNAPVPAALLSRCDPSSVLVVGTSRAEEDLPAGVRGVDEVCALRAPCVVVLVDLEDAPDERGEEA